MAVEKVREKAMLCVGRAVFFGYLAISMVMLSFLFDLVLFFRSGAILTFMLAAVLVWYAQTAETRRPQLTETWILLDEPDRPENDHARRLFGETLKEVYLYFAVAAFRVGLGLFAASFLFALFDVRYLFND